MDFKSYLSYFQKILTDDMPQPPYTNNDYMEYTRLNRVRMNRWLKTGELNSDVLTAANYITEPQKWIVITEPWCGDAAHIVPFLDKIAALNPLVSIDYELRDSPPFRINDYLTNGGKSIPKLIIRDESNKDLASWGPRPVECQHLYQRLMAEKAGFETLKSELQKWYNDDRGREIQKEIAALILQIKATENM